MFISNPDHFLSSRLLLIQWQKEMKLSLKFQDDPLHLNNQTQIITAKLPITILSQPFVSGLTTTTSDSASDISFSVSTSFPSGPSLKLSYSPTLSSSSYPLFLSLKSGLGLFGSPHNSPLVFSAKFSLSPANVIVPTFSLHFKPQFGHFSLGRSVISNHSSDHYSGYLTNGRFNLNNGLQNDAPSEFTNGFASEGSSVWQEVKLEPFDLKDEFKSTKKKENLGNDSNIGPDESFVSKNNQKYGFLSGVSVMATTMIPVAKRAMLKLRCGVHLPGDVSLKMPYLTLNKIEIERVEAAKEVKEAKKKNDVDNSEANFEFLKGRCLWMARDIEVLEKNNREMKQHLEELMKVRNPSASRNHGMEDNGIGVKKVTEHTSGRPSESDWSRSRMNIRAENGQKEVKKSIAPVSDLECELQKAIKAASS